MTLFSVIVPAYNAEDTLAETLQAIAEQTFSDWECIVVDDGSEDSTPQIARSFSGADARFRLVSQENRGTGGAYNTGVRSATGEWVTICSADDVLLPSLLARTNELISDGVQADIISCNGYYWNPDGTRQLVYGEAVKIPESWTLADVIARCFYSVGACYRRILFDRNEGYLEHVFGEDYDFWLRAMASGARHRYIDEPLSLHRLSATQKSANLVRSYESDIAIISALVDSATLAEEEVRAAQASIAERHRLIREVNAPNSAPARLVRAARALRGRLGKLKRAFTRKSDR